MRSTREDEATDIRASWQIFMTVRVLVARETNDVSDDRTRVRANRRTQVGILEDGVRTPVFSAVMRARGLMWGYDDGE